MEYLPSRPRVVVRLTLIALALLLVGARLAAANAPVWLKTRGDNFVIYSDGSQGDLLDFAVRYKAYQLAFRTMFLPPGRALPPTVLVLFKRYAAMSEYLPGPSRSDGRTVNYSIESDGIAYSALALSDGRNKAFERTGQFETAWALRRLGYRLPLWASQGAGDMLSTVRVSKGRCLLGEVSTDHAHNFSLRSDGFPWPRFFEITYSSPEYNDGRTLWKYDAQAGELMNWVLLKDGETFERFGRLARKLRSVPPQVAVEEVMGVPATEFNRLINEHLGRKSTVREISFDDVAVRAKFQVENVSDAEILAQTATFLSAAGKPERCEEHLARAYVQAPNLPVVREAKARHAIQQQDPDEAVRLYREAIANGSTNPVAFLRSATSRLNGSSADGRDQSGSGGLNATTAVDEIRRALQFSPGNFEAYVLLGRAFYLLPKVTEDLLPELAAGLTPGEESWQLRYYYGLLQERLGRPEECLAEFQRILALPDLEDQTKRYVEQQRLNVNFRTVAAKVKTLVEEKQFAAAKSLLEESVASADSRARDNYTRLLNWVRQREEQR